MCIGDMVDIGLVARPTLGGLLIAQWGWQSVFWINVPISLFGIWRGIQLIPLFIYHQKVKRDFTGAVCFILFSFCFLYALDEGSTQSWTSALIMGAFALSALFFVGFYMREQKSPAPFIGLSIFNIQAISYWCIVSVLGFISLH